MNSSIHTDSAADQMKPRFGTAALMFLSSYAPLLIIVAVLDRLNHRVIDLSLLVVAAVAWRIPFSILARLKGGLVYTITEPKNKSGDLVQYALPYLVSFIGLKIEETPSVIAFALFMILFGALTIRTQALWINPLLALAGYRLYEANLERSGCAPRSAMLLSKTALSAGERVKAEYLTESQLYVTERTDTGGGRESRSETLVRPDQED